MAELTEEERQAQELKNLKDNSPFALPDDPSSSGWSTAQIKEKFWTAIIILYGYLLTERQRITDLEEEGVDGILEELEKFKDGRTIVKKAVQDKNGNAIDETYAESAKIIDGTIAALKYIKADGTTANIRDLLNDIEGNHEAFTQWIANYFTNNKANNAINAENAIKATKDGNGNIIANTYATVGTVNAVRTLINNAIDGVLVVSKAAKDQNGAIIDQTYVKKSQIVNALDSTSTDAPLSAYQGKVLKGMIDAINTLLASDDTSLDQLQEVVTYIKTNRDLITAITTAKVNVTDIIDNLTSSVSNKPLSAKQGYVLKGLIDALHNTFEPTTSATYDLGSSSKKWKNLYLSGKITDGTHEASVEKIIEVSEGLGEILEALVLINGEDEEEES